MTQEEIIEGNKLIAEFMGYEFTETPDYGILGGSKFTKVPKIPNEPPFTIYHGWQPPKYNESWDCLMFVIKKCLSISEEELADWEHYYEAIDDSLFQVEILGTWKEVINFIKWYNNETL